MVTGLSVLRVSGRSLVCWVVWALMGMDYREREGGREGGRERYYDNSMAYTCMYMYMNVFILHVSIL